MKKWIIDYEDEAKEDFDNLDGSQRGYVFKAIDENRDYFCPKR